MEYTHDKEQAATYAKKAFDRISKLTISPTPEMYELWYVYYAKCNPEVVKEIDGAEKEQKNLDEAFCAELYQRFLSKDRGEEAVRRAGAQINATISDMTDAVRDVKDATTEYSGKLGGVNSQISTIEDAEQLRGILQVVMSDTESMLEHNIKLEKQLDQSTLVMEELQRDLETFRKEALTDGLTGLANRKSFDGEIERITKEAAANGSTFTLLMADIDHFKTFNDNFGHQVGDQVLRLVAKTLTDGVKGRDMAARYGGEEFAIILPETNLTAGVTVGNALRKAMASKDVVNRNSGEKLARITMSIGVAEYVPGEKTASLIERADAALYTAKHNGRNQVAAAPTPAKA
ncbi:MAG: GGDEF domain-containing protein [Rhodospirillales bacterium]|nr:GGDEF domain-containing protein [Rhodospirillales bacterium]